MQDVLSITMKQTKLSLQGFTAASRKKAEELYRKVQKSNLDKQILLIQKAMAINPFAAKYQKAYAEILYKLGHAEQAQEHMHKAHGLAKAHRTIAKLKIAKSSIKAAAITQYYTGIFADWTQGYTIAAHILHQARQKSYTGKSTVHFASLPKKGENPEENRHYKTNTRWLNRSSSEAEIENTSLASLSYPNRWSIVAKSSKKYPRKAIKIIATITLLLCLKLTITNKTTAQTASGIGMVLVGDEVDNIRGRYAKVTYTMIEDTEQTHEFETSETGLYWFNDINLVPTHVNKPNNQQTPNIINYTSQGQDHNITTPKTSQPATIYTIQGQAIATLQPNTLSDYSHFYWNPNNIPAGTYIFTTNINDYPVSQKLIQTNSKILVGNFARNNLDSDHNARWLRDSRNENRLETTANPKPETRNTKPETPALSKLEVRNKDLTTATFLVHIEPGTQQYSTQFLPQTDTITLHEGEDNYPIHYVQPIPQKVHQTIKLICEQTHQPLTNFTIRGRENNPEGEIYDETQTDTNGNATLILPPSTAVRLEYGPEIEHGADTSYYASKGNTWNTQNVHYANDTINHDTIRLALPNKNLIIPQTTNDPSPETIWTPAIYVREMIRGPPDDFLIESAVRNEIRVWLSDTYTEAQRNTILNVNLPAIDSLFYGEQEPFPYVVVENEIDVNGIPSNQYHHINNYYPGLLGFNIRPGGAQVTTKKKDNYELTIINDENTDFIDAILGGEVQTNTTFTTFNKETYGRAHGFNDVTLRPSFMNPTSTDPNYYDRAVTYIIRTNHKNRAEGKNSYTLGTLVDEL